MSVHCFEPVKELPPVTSCAPMIDVEPALEDGPRRALLGGHSDGSSRSWVPFSRHKVPEDMFQYHVVGLALVVYNSDLLSLLYDLGLGGRLERQTVRRAIVGEDLLVDHNGTGLHFFLRTRGRAE